MSEPTSSAAAVVAETIVRTVESGVTITVAAVVRELGLSWNTANVIAEHATQAIVAAGEVSPS